MGTPPHIPTPEMRAEVAALVSFGNNQEQIANYMRISQDTLAKYYKHELETSVLSANARVANALFRKATEQDDLGAQIFWLKTRARWREKDRDDPQNEDLVKDIVKRKKQLDAKNKKEY